MVLMRKLLVLITLILAILIVSVTVYSVSDYNPPAQERPSPGDWIKEEQIKVYSDKVILNVPNTIWATFTNTNSMDPFFDETAHAIETIPSNPLSINEGDIISFNSPSGVLIHRVVSRNNDELGIYYTVKGDNSSVEDPFKVRFDDIQGVVVAVIY